jgi:hypothetical protein
MISAPSRTRRHRRTLDSICETLRDRLIRSCSWFGARTLAEGNTLLPDYNARLAKPPANRRIAPAIARRRRSGGHICLEGGARLVSGADTAIRQDGFILEPSKPAPLQIDGVVCRFRFSATDETPYSRALWGPTSGGCGLDGASPAAACSTIRSMPYYPSSSPPSAYRDISKWQKE